MDRNFLNELQSLDPNNIGSWPVAAKVFVIGFVCAVVLVMGYMLDTSVQLQQLDVIRAQEATLKEEFIREQKKAVNLEQYKAQMEEMKESFGTMLRQLPSKTEVAALLVDITQAGLASGLEFELFKPEGETPKEFYAELPIKLKVSGNYHQFGEFISAVAALPRIVTMHEITVQSLPKQGELVMEAEAKTYRYLDDDEQAELAAANKKPATRR